MLSVGQKFPHFSLTGVVSNDLAHAFLTWNIIHRIEHRSLENAAQTTRTSFLFGRFFGGGIERFFGESQLHTVEFKETTILFGDGILGLVEHAHEAFFVERIEHGPNRQTTDKFRN